MRETENVNNVLTIFSQDNCIRFFGKEQRWGKEADKEAPSNNFMQ